MTPWLQHELLRPVFFLASCCQYRIRGIRYNVLIRQGGPADTTVLEAEMENNINDQENSKYDADSVLDICKYRNKSWNKMGSHLSFEVVF